jgi:hypothetical protein
MQPSKSSRYTSAIGTTFLIPFVFLPYRWLWLPCGLGAMLLLLPSRRPAWEAIRRYETIIFGAPVVLVPRTALDPGWWFPWVGILVLLVWLRTRPWWHRRAALVATPVIWIVAICVLTRPIQWPFLSTSTAGISKDAVLVCAGDSLTSGIDINSDQETYVARLRERLPCKVLNAGVANDKAADLLARLDKDVVSRRPTASASRTSFSSAARRVSTASSRSTSRRFRRMPPTWWTTSTDR